MQDGTLHYITGKTRNGKTTKALELLNRFNGRCFIWDPKPEFFKLANSRLSRNSEQLINSMFIGRDRCVSYRPNIITPAQFNFFCIAVKTYAEHRGRCMAVIEESADVCGPGKAPASYGTLCRQGLGLGMDIVAIGQRPQESDKTSLSQATFVYCFAMSRPGDRAYMAAELECDESKIPTKKYTYIYKRDDWATVKTGRTVKK